jgi:large subunit ribosomal protein L35
MSQCYENKRRREVFLAIRRRLRMRSIHQTAQQRASCDRRNPGYLPRLMPKSIARSKTRKAVAKRFKITSRGKVLRSQAAKRHLMSSKNAKRKRQASKTIGVDKTDVKRIKMNLPFG